MEMSTFSLEISSVDLEFVIDISTHPLEVPRDDSDLSCDGNFHLPTGNFQTEVILLNPSLLLTDWNITSPRSIA